MLRSSHYSAARFINFLLPPRRANVMRPSKNLHESHSVDDPQFTAEFAAHKRKETFGCAEIKASDPNRASFIESRPDGDDPAPSFARQAQ